MLMECLARGARSRCRPRAPRSQVGRAHHQRLQPGAQPVQDSHRKFEGIEEALARIGGNTYAIDAAHHDRGRGDLGEKPSVISAIVKYHCTERGRQVISDAMDVHGGKGICLAPTTIWPRLPADSDWHHRRRCQHSHPQHDDLRPGCDPLPSLCAREIAATRTPNPAEASGKFDDAFWITCVCARQRCRALCWA